MGEIVLEECHNKNGVYLGKIIIQEEDLTRQMHELFSSQDLAQLASQTFIPLDALSEMTWIAFIKSDIASKDLQGFRKYQKLLIKK